MNLKTPALAVSAAGFAGVARAALRYAAAYARAERQWLRWTEERLGDIGEVDAVTVLPLAERVTAGPRLRGEPGLSYLVTAGARKLLFDTGLNMRREETSALIHNAAELGADLTALDAVVISHLHADHVGGPGRQLRRTFGFSRHPLEPRGIPAHVPVPMEHERAQTILTTAPRIIAPGVAVLPPLPRALFWLGPTEEQAMVVNVRGFGLVLLSGCGHPPVERTLAAAERVLDVPVKGVVGGLHLPVHPLGTPLIPQAVLGSPHPPWRLVDERDAAAVMDAIAERGPRVVALSGHDSTPWTFDRFAERFGGSYNLLRVGEQLHISASGADLAALSAAQSVTAQAVSVAR
jgi:7,8-dihydropterin-6-yl-methyl-4-(beta-D-ribofuranosyl)aminobenzene 5'-phosphate synthase